MVVVFVFVGVGSLSCCQVALTVIFQRQKFSAPNKMTRQAQATKATVDFYKLRYCAAVAVTQGGVSERAASKMFALSRNQVRYWKQKLVDDSFLVNNHGGYRHRKLTPTDQALLFYLAKAFPQTKLAEFSAALKLYTGTCVSPATICVLFRSWGWSYHAVEYKQQLKYTATNIKRYFEHMLAMPSIVQRHGMGNIKFLDEVHFVSKEMDKRTGVGPRGKKIYVRRWTDIKETFTMTLMTIPNRSIPVAAEIRRGSNTQFDYALFLADCMSTGALTRGDVLVIDNASVHVGRATFELICTTLQRIGVKLLLLPMYSPELNPAEMVFAFIKNKLRNNRDATIGLVDNIVSILTELTRDMLLRMYRHCIFHPDVQ